MSMHFATVWETIADAIPDEVGASSTATCGGPGGSTTSAPPAWPRRCTAAGLGPDSKIGIYLYNGNEYLETQYAGFKLRGVPVNVNYRYLDDELWYLLDNADAEALVFHASLGDRVARVARPAPEAEAAGGGRRRRCARPGTTVAVALRGPDRRPRADGSHRAARGRRLHALHRRHHGHAQGRDVHRRRHHAGLHHPWLPAARPSNRPPRWPSSATSSRPPHEAGNTWSRSPAARSCTAPACGSAR